MNEVTDMDWNDLRVLLAVCREGSLAGAARVLGTSHSTVFRQVNKIEKKFAARFFNRLPSGYEMTEAGELVLRLASDIEEDIHELRRELQGKDLRFQGTIRLTAPEGVSHYLLMPYLASFYKKHPAVNIELLPSSVNFEMARGDADVAIRVTNSPPQNCIAKKVCDFQMGLYASDAYLKATEGREVWQYEYLLCHFYLSFLSQQVWKGHPTPRISFSSDNILAIANAAKADLGVAALPCLIGEKESGLKRIDAPNMEFFRSEIWVLTHSDLRQTARVRALVDHLYDSLKGDQTVILGGEGNRS